MSRRKNVLFTLFASNAIHTHHTMQKKETFGKSPLGCFSCCLSSFRPGLLPVSRTDCDVSQSQLPAAKSEGLRGSVNALGGREGGEGFRWLCWRTLPCGNDHVKETLWLNTRNGFHGDEEEEVHHFIFTVRFWCSFFLSVSLQFSCGYRSCESEPIIDNLIEHPPRLQLLE